MTTTSGGNISVTDSNGDIWITPSAVDKGSLSGKDIVCVKKNGKNTGPHVPSSELPFHEAIYSARPDIRAIIHAHPPALVAFSIVRTKPDMNITPHTKLVCGTIGYAGYALPGGGELGGKIASAFKAGHNCVILENHGAVVGGENLPDAYTRFETLEFACRTIIGARTIGAPVYLKEDQIKKFKSQVSADLPEQEKVNHSKGETAIRQNICDLGRRACKQGLMPGAYGSLSVRLKDNDFLITPASVSRWDIKVDDIVQIRGGKREPGKHPDHSVIVHDKIYKKHPHINSIVFAQPPNIMAFGITNARLDVRTIPESWIFLQDIPVIKFGDMLKENNTVPGSLNPDTPALLIQNDSIIVTGDKLLDTFDRLEIAEFSAKSLIMSTAIGKFVPIDKKDIEDLREKFLS